MAQQSSFSGSEIFHSPLLILHCEAPAADAFEAAFGLQDSAKGQSVAKNAELAALVVEMNEFKGALRHHVINNTINNPGARAAWTSAAHVEKARKKKAPPTPPTP